MNGRYRENPLRGGRRRRWRRAGKTQTHCVGSSYPIYRADARGPRGSSPPSHPSQPYGGVIRSNQNQTTETRERRTGQRRGKKGSPFLSKPAPKSYAHLSHFPSVSTSAGHKKMVRRGPFSWK